jgi:hypothetical protein
MRQLQRCTRATLDEDNLGGYDVGYKENSKLKAS